MSRDDQGDDRFARLRAHMKDGFSQADRARAEGERIREEARRAHDEAHRRRDAERARKQGKRPLDAEAIAAAGVAIADAQGVEAVSMRKIAAVLGSGTMSLYHYVRTKEELLAAMDDVVMGEILVAPRELKGGWRKAIRAIALQTRDAHRRHPWALTLQSGAGRPGINSLRHVEQSLAALADTGLDFESKMALILTVDNYVFGHSLRSLERDGAEDAVGLDEITAFLGEHLTPADFPELMGAIGDGTPADLMARMMTAFDPDEWFDIGLEAILDGLERHLKIKGAE